MLIVMRHGDSDVEVRRVCEVFGVMGYLVFALLKPEMF